MGTSFYIVGDNGETVFVIREEGIGKQVGIDFSFLREGEELGGVRTAELRRELKGC